MTRLAVTAAALMMSGCAWQQGALQPLGRQAVRIAGLGDLFLAITGLVFVLVVGTALWAFARGAKRARANDDAPILEPSGEPRLTRAVTASTVVSLLLLAILLIASVATGRSLSEFAPPKPLRVKITAYQWWWKIEYPGNHPDEQVVTANELHVPAGRPVELELKSGDVIHSFWLPNLDGKHDLIPSQPKKVLFEAERLGTYAGRCAEFCGYQHAHMDILLVAQTPSEFEAWLAGQRQPAAEPQTDRERRGREIMEQSACALCHTVSGTKALGGVGPDLSHLASRRTLATGAAVREREAMKAWLSNPQQLKPGTQMPAIALSSPDMAALLDYLETLR